MLETLGILAVGLMPPLLSVWMMRRAQARSRAKLRQAINAATRMRIHQDRSDPPIPERYYLAGVGYLIGDVSCRFNAKSGYIRCAVNPSGPCRGCRHYEQQVESQF